MPVASVAATATIKEPFNVTELVAPMQALHDTCENHTFEWRVSQLQRLRRMLVEQWDAWARALQADLGKCRVEAAVMELIMVRTDLDYTLTHLKQWMKPQPIATPMTNLPGFTRLEQRPLCGPAVLVIGGLTVDSELTH
jgi:aldehyde dehydrogenase (NAD+)